MVRWRAGQVSCKMMLRSAAEMGGGHEEFMVEARSRRTKYVNWVRLVQLWNNWARAVGLMPQGVN